MSLPKQKEIISPSRTATAPYNFVPLPERVITVVDDARDLPPHDTYATPSHPHTGYFEVTLTTRSPLYIRGGLSTTARPAGQNRSEWEVSEAQKKSGNVQDFRDLMKNKPEFFHTQNETQPVLPGSSLRGMLRALLEIASYGKVSWVTNALKMYYRAVAAPTDDPLGPPYDATQGPYGRYIRAGYLLERDGTWYIKPAKKPQRGAFLSIKERFIPGGVIPGLKRFDDEDYRPAYHTVQFVTENYQDRRGRPAQRINIVESGRRNAQPGILVCSGNMLETGGEVESPRKKHTVVLEVNASALERRIAPQAVSDYCSALTPFQKEPPFSDQTGCLVNGRPIFYIEAPGDITQFGHTPNFRVAAINKQAKRATTPLDFVPPCLRRPLDVDYADALFGYVRRKDDFAKNAAPKQGDSRRAYAGRVSVTDAVLVDNPAPEKLWLMGSAQQALEPKILATPKPTAFQHYLVQTDDRKPHLKHYDSVTPEETVIRGHKLYWHQGDPQPTALKPQVGDPNTDPQGRPLQNSTQHTRMSPVRSGNTFRFRVYFQNLSDAELGALCWTLHPAGDDAKDYCHSLGMGKPLGLGAVKLSATLHLTDRAARYQSLFAGDGWEEGRAGVGEDLSDVKTRNGRTKPFEDAILKALGSPGGCARLSDLKRIAILLKMMEWHAAAQVPTQTLPLQAPPGVPSFRARSVLPSPEQVGDLTGIVVPDIPLEAVTEESQGTEPEQGKDKEQDKDKEQQGKTDKGQGPSEAEMAREAQIQKALADMFTTSELKAEKEPEPKASEPPPDGPSKPVFAQMVPGGNPRVKLPSGEVIACAKLNVYAAPGWAKGWCRVIITYAKGKPERVAFDRWPKDGEV